MYSASDAEWSRAVLFRGSAERILWAAVLLGEIRNPNSLMQTATHGIAMGSRMLDRRSGPNGIPLRNLGPIAMLWSILTPPFQGGGGWDSYR